MLEHYLAIKQLEEAVIPWQKQPHGPPSGQLADYAKRQRQIRSLQPKVSSAEAHDRARRALAAAGQPVPANPPAKTKPSSAGQPASTD